MHVKTMEGLIGARVNMNLTREPMRVFREASRKDDFATMERAMGYVNEYEDRAFEYKKTADDGMEKRRRKTERKKNWRAKRPSKNAARSGRRRRKSWRPSVRRTRQRLRERKKPPQRRKAQKEKILVRESTVQIP